MNYVADLRPMLMTIKVNVVSSVIGSTLSLSSVISQLHGQGHMSSERVVDIVLIYKLRCTLIRTHFMIFLVFKFFLGVLYTYQDEYGM